MSVLLDTCISGSVRTVLEDAGHDATWSGDWDHDPGDAEILARALHEGRVLVTLDKDFGELAILRGASHSGILRIVNFPARQQASVCLRVLAEHGPELASGAIITAEPGRVRIRLPDSSTGP